MSIKCVGFKIEEIVEDEGDSIVMKFEVRQPDQNQKLPSHDTAYIMMHAHG